tara:strand:- start:196 stop:606 length:411 start_codon:yes stop_codon:yes gene_type:complete
MQTQSSKNTKETEGEVLKPSYRLPLLIIGFGLLLLLIPTTNWPTIIISGFGFFLLLQSFTLRLKFTDNDLIVLQLGKELRKFPFKNWISWRILLPQLPGLFYFREEASPHLLPILFDPDSLEKQLKKHVGSLQVRN